MMKTYRGSCHCGAVTFEAKLDLAAGSYRCNCSICAKTRYWGANVKPGDFRQLTGAEALTDYRFGTRRVGILFCRHCGVPPFTLGSLANPEDVSISLAALDDVQPAELLSGPVTYLDGRHDNWDSAPDETRHL